MQSLKQLEAGKLKVLVYNNREEMGKAAAEDGAKRINQIIQEKGTANAVFAAAPSQNEFLAHLLKQDVSWDKVRAFHLDEYIGLAADAVQGFGNFLDNAFFSKVPLMETYYINGQTEDPRSECLRYANILEKFLPDIVFLGIGENGHLAFNDPAFADFNDPEIVKIVDLDMVCRNQQVNDGCFQKLDDVPTKAFTLTMSFLFKIPEAVLVVPGEAKRAAVKNTLYAEISPAIPASIMRKHPSAALYVEKESGSDLFYENSFLKS